MTYNVYYNVYAKSVIVAIASGITFGCNAIMWGTNMFPDRAMAIISVLSIFAAKNIVDYILK